MTQFTHFTQDTAPTQYAEGGGIRFAYRRFGIPSYRRSGVPERLPLVFFQHFMGTLDDHDPALSDAFAGDREVILFNNASVASSAGTVPDTIEAMARDAISFIDALGLDTIDMVGHSMGGLGRRARLCRAHHRPPRPRHARLGQSIAAQRAALAAYGAIKDASYAHLKGLELPVLVVNGTDDIVIPTINSYILQQFLPSAELILYPDANHGSHFQYPELFVRHARIFLDD